MWDFFIDFTCLVILSTRLLWNFYWHGYSHILLTRFLCYFDWQGSSGIFIDNIILLFLLTRFIWYFYEQGISVFFNDKYPLLVLLTMFLLYVDWSGFSGICILCTFSTLPTVLLRLMINKSKMRIMDPPKLKLNIISNLL